VECGSFGLLILTFFLSFVFLYFWSEAQNDYNDFDWFNFGTLGFWFPWSLVLLVVAAALFTYIALLLVLAVCLLSEGQRLYLHWSHKTGIVVTLAFSVTATAILSDLWSKEWKTLLLSLQVTAPFLHVAAVSLMAILSWPIALHFFRMNKRVRQVAVLGLYLSVLFSLYLVPLGMYSPCIKEAGTLGPAPALIGHRGAPMLAPENTVMSFEKAVEAGGEGLETDVTIRSDASVLPSAKVLWLPSEDEELVRLLDPELQQTSEKTVQELTDGHITRLNLLQHHVSTTDQYQSVNMVPQPVCDQPAWLRLAGVLELSRIPTPSMCCPAPNKPLFLMTPEEYSLMWILTDAVSALLIITIFIFHWWRERGLPFWSGSRQTHENGPYSKFRTDSSEVICVPGALSSDPLRALVLPPLVFNHMTPLHISPACQP
ncbi:glycerophosphodiester phosphodiesterase domain-containing protein 5-like isoform X2, partial [Lates japonicus]